MYNSNLPDHAELPSSSKLWKSTIIAGVSALAILFGALLPAEYGIDPTGVGRALGLTQMGEIKQQLAADAAADASNSVAEVAQAESLVSIERRLQGIEERLGIQQMSANAGTSEAAQADAIAAAPAAQNEAPAESVQPEAQADVAVLATEPPPDAGPVKSDVVEIVLEPGQGAEIKLEMVKDGVAAFAWTVDGGVVNYDTHGDPPNPPENFYHGYGKGRGSAGESGTLKAAFDGNHGWFWRNRGDVPVIVRLETRGTYVKIKRVV